MKSVTSGGTSADDGFGRGDISLNRTTRVCISSGPMSTVVIAHPSSPLRPAGRRPLHSPPAAPGLHERGRSTLRAVEWVADPVESQAVVERRFVAQGDGGRAVPGVLWTAAGAGAGANGPQRLVL